MSAEYCFDSPIVPNATERLSPDIEFGLSEVAHMLLTMKPSSRAGQGGILPTRLCNDGDDIANLRLDIFTIAVEFVAFPPY